MGDHDRRRRSRRSASCRSRSASVGQAIVGLEERDPDGPVSVVGGGRLAGEVASHETFPLQDKIVSLLMLIAGFNFFIGMFNFMPLLPLDGGHIAGALYEGAEPRRAPGCAAVPTPATSTSPSCCRSRTSWRWPCW